KGHGAPGLYAAMHMAGILKEDPMTLRLAESPVEGHPVPRVPGVRVATGSLGQGLSAGLGLAHAMKLDEIERTVYVLLGDGEMAEGNVWEAINLAPHMNLGNVVAIVDVNRLAQSDATVYGWDTDAYHKRVESFGWHVQTVDGHDPEALIEAFENARADERPSCIVAKTVKGKGASFLENEDGRHGKAVGGEELEKALSEITPLIKEVDYEPSNQLELECMPEPVDAAVQIETEYERGEQVATRTAYGKALAKIGKQQPNVVALDGDVKGSSRTKFFFSDFPERSVEGYIAEQNIVAMAAGLSARGKRPHLATFAAFLTRAHDQIRMASYSRSRINIAGSHSGVSIGEDGPSQMGLEDLAMMRSVYGSVVLSPSDAVSAEKLTGLANGHSGISYVRTIRVKTPVLYDNNRDFSIGGSMMITSNPDDKLMIVATGFPVHQALEAAEKLKGEGVHVGVMDVYSIKPLDRRSLRRAADTVPAFLTVEDHYPEGGLGEAVSGVVSGLVPVHSIAVTKMPHSGATKTLIAEQQLDTDGIVARCKEIIGSTS
ncbi:MAG: transketolase, partial [Spirochaetota bacterium]